jgi:putative sigma-54 modulation protein
MQVTIQGHSMNVSQRLDKYVRNKTEKLDRYLPGVEEVRVEFTRQSAKADAPKEVELTVRRKRTILRVEQQDNDPFAAFDSALEKMYQRIARYKGRKIDKARAGEIAPEGESMEHAEELPIDAPPAAPAPKVVRIKSFPIVPMKVDDAIDQMELLSHDFYVFVHEDDSVIKVVYRRKEGSYGLLQPDVKVKRK